MSIESGTMPPPIDETPGLSQIDRLSNILFAPSKTFIDIRDKNRSWWMPFMLSILFVYVFFSLVTVKVGWRQVADNVIASDAKAQERLAQAPNPTAAKEQAVNISSLIIQVTAWGSAALALIGALVASLILWGSINFIFGGKSKFVDIFCLWMYAGLPGIFKFIVSSVMVFINAPDAFNIKSFSPTTLSTWLPADTNKFLMAIAMKIDITDIWSMVLLSIGLAILAKVNRSSGYIVVFGWWCILLCFGLIGAAFSG